MQLVHVADFYNTETNHPLNKITDLLTEKGHEVEVWTSNQNHLQTPSKDKSAKARIIRFPGIPIGHKVIIPKLISHILLEKTPEVYSAHVLGFFSTFILGIIKFFKPCPLVVFSDYTPRKTQSLFQRVYDEVLQGIPARNATRIICYTQKMKNAVNKTFNVSKTKIEVIPIGTNVKSFQTKIHVSKKKLNIIMISNISSHWKGIKNIELAINALFAVNNQNIQVMHVGELGDKEYVKKLKTLISEKKLQKQFTFKGKASRKALLKEYNKADVFLQTSKSESYGIPSIEALAAGLPVISTSVGIAQEIIKKENGFIVENENEIKDALRKLMKTSLRKKMGTANKKLALQFDWKHLITKIEKMYKQVKT